VARAANVNEDGVTTENDFDALPPDPSTLDGLFRVNVLRRPDAMALADPADRAAITDGEPRTLTYAQAHRAVNALAAQFVSLGLLPGSVIGLQLPNTVESVIALLAASRAGLVPAPVPLLWRRAEAARGLAAVNAKALVVCGHVGATQHGELALHTAADIFGLRFVCGFGSDLPDGIVPLDDIWEGGLGAFAPFSHQTSDETALITFDMGTEGPLPVARSHGELMAGGLAVMAESGLPRHAAIVGTMLASSFAVLATTTMPWLITGGALVLHHPFDAGRLSAQLADGHCDAVAAPGPLIGRLAEAGVLGDSAARVLAIWRSPERHADSAGWTGSALLTDVLAFGETGLVPLNRGSDGRPGALKAGPVRAPSASSDGAVVATLARTPHGTLALGGPIAPKSLRIAAPADLPIIPDLSGGESDQAAASAFPPPLPDAVDTGLPCRLDAATGLLTLTGGPPGLVSVGGYRFVMRELENLVGRAQADGVLAALPDLLAGGRLAGRAADITAMRRALEALGSNPLVAEAFRDRREPRAPAA
jgi:hypothetical protein